MQAVIQKHLDDRSDRLWRWDDFAVGVKVDFPISRQIDGLQFSHEVGIAVVGSLLNNCHASQVHGVGANVFDQQRRVRENTLEGGVRLQLCERANVGLLILQKGFEVWPVGHQNVPIQHKKVEGLGDGKRLVISEVETIFTQDQVDALFSLLDLPIARKLADAIQHVIAMSKACEVPTLWFIIYLQIGGLRTFPSFPDASLNEQGDG